MSRGRKSKWTHEIRVCLFRLIVERYGPGNNFTKLSVREQKLFSKNVASILSEKYKDNYSEGGPLNQISWALTNQRNLKSVSCISNWIRCRAAALDAGLIKQKDLPTEMNLIYKEPN